MFNEVIKEDNSKDAKWLVCFNCGEPLTKVDREITCLQPYYHCEKCNIIQDGDIGQLYHCCRCGRVVEQTEALIYEFTTPNWHELSFCPKPTGIKQYLCGKCHKRAIRPKRFKKLRKFISNCFWGFLVFIYAIFRPRKYRH